ncbi:bromodomain adjacent to zinc finger domain protein 2B-like isoform X4 [Lineus longissimus]|uniref:bromodomain adjacent to zinc finger domain protein 2B-like isoform X4 n=1 Tax=Lineus longissimus TaxID=88925 RepID=UPI00315D5A97
MFPIPGLGAVTAMERGDRNSHSPGPNVNYFDGANLIGHPFSSAAASMVTTSPFSPLANIHPSAFSMLGRPPLFPGAAPFGGLGTLEGFGLRSPFGSGLSPTTGESYYGGADWWRLASEHARRLAAGTTPEFYIGGLAPSLSPTFGLHTGEASPTGFDALLRQSQSSLFGLTPTPMPVSEATASKASAGSSKDTVTTVTVTTAKSSASTTLTSSRASPASVSSHGTSITTEAIGRSSAKPRKKSHNHGIPTSVITSIPKMAESSVSKERKEHKKGSKMPTMEALSDSDLDVSSGSLSMDTPSELSSDEEGEKDKQSQHRKDLKRKSDSQHSNTPPEKRHMTSITSKQSVKDTAIKNRELLMNSPLSITDCIARQHKIQQMAHLDHPKPSPSPSPVTSSAPLDLSKKDTSAFSVPAHLMLGKQPRKQSRKQPKFLQQQQVMTEKERMDHKKRQELLKLELEAQLKQQQLELKMAKKAVAEREKHRLSQQNAFKSHKGKPGLTSSSPSLSQSSRSSKTSHSSIARMKPEPGEGASGMSDDDSLASGSDSDSDSSSSSGSSSGSASEGESGSVGRQTTGDENGMVADQHKKRRKPRPVVDETDIRIPLEHGWRRETRIRTMSSRGIVGDVIYYAPCGKRLKTYPEVTKYLEKNAITDLSRVNFSFSPKISVGDFLEQRHGGGGQGDNGFVLLTEEEVLERMMLTKMKKLHQMGKMKKKEKKKNSEDLAKQAADHKLKKKLEQQEMSRKSSEMKLKSKHEKRQQVEAHKRAKEMRANERKKAKEQERLLRHQEKMQRQEHIRIEREVRAQQLLEERRRRKEESQNMKVAEMVRKAKEREMKRQQAVILKEQAAQQEREQRRRMLVMASMERERRRQHMLLVKALEARKRQEERERMREEKNNEKRINRQRKFEQRQYEMQVAREMKKPIEDMQLADHKPVPELKRIKGVKLAGEALADAMMVIEFLNNFGIALGFDLDSLPSLNTLQLALLNDDEYIDEYLSLITHLLKFALEDPGVPNPKDALTQLGHKIMDMEINDDNLSEILRIFIQARNGKPDDLSNLLLKRPLTSLNSTQKAACLAFVCNELLCSKNIVSEIDKNIDTMTTLRRDKWVVEGKVRKLRILQARKFNRPIPAKQLADDSSMGCQDSSLLGLNNASISSKRGSDDEDDDKDSDDSDAGSEITGTDADDEDEPATIEELEKRLEKLSKQHSQFRDKVFCASHKLRAMAFGQDRYHRRYWVLPFAGGIYVEGLESAEPELMTKVERKTVSNCDEAFLGKSGCELIKSDEKDLNLSAGLKSQEIADKMCESNIDSVDSKESDFATVLQNMMCVKKKDSDVKADDQGPHKGEALGTTMGEIKREIADIDGAVKEEKMEVDGMEKISVKMEVDVQKDTVEAENKMDVDCVKTELNSVKMENGDIVEECVKSKAIKMETEINDLDVKVKDENGKVEDSVKVKEENSDVKEEKVEVKQEDCEPSLVNGIGTPPVNSLFQRPNSASNLSDLARKSESPYQRTPKKSDIFNNSAIKTGASTESSPGFMSIDSILKKEDPGPHYNNSCSPFLPFPPSGPLSAEQMLKNLSERQGQKPWFSILPRMPCDESTLTRTPSNLSQMSNSQMSNSPSPSPSPFFLPVPYSAFQVHNPMFASYPMGQLQYSPFNFSLPGGGYQPMKTSGMMNGEEGTPPHSSFNRSYETSTPNTSSVDPERLSAPKPIPIEKQRGWWRITNAEELRALIRSLHSRGICEKLLQKTLQKYADYACESCTNGNNEALVMEETPLDEKLTNPDTGAPDPDDPDSYLKSALYEMNMNVLDEVENMEERVYGASLQIKGWKIPQHSSDSEQEKDCKEKDVKDKDGKEKDAKEKKEGKMEKKKEIDGRTKEGRAEKKEKKKEKDAESKEKEPKPEKSKAEKEAEKLAKAEKEARKAARLEERKLHALESAKYRLLTLEKNIERRYLKPPLNKRLRMKSLQLNIPAVVSPDPKTGKPEKEDETQVSQGLLTWRRAVETAHSAAQLHMCLVHLNNCIAWEKSIMKVICQICMKDDNEAQLLLCDGCDKGYHTYCFKPKMDNIPDGEWYCFECVTKATGCPHCVVCGKKGGRLAECDHCPRCFHIDCLIPPLPRVPRKWSCITCVATKGKAKRRRKSTATPKDAKEKPDTPKGKGAKDKDNKKEEKETVAMVTDNGAAEKEKKDREPVSALDESSEDMGPCKSIMPELQAHDKAWPFLKAVNSKQFPQYKKIIRRPMDFGTMEKKLRDNVYKCQADFANDTRQVFNNCETFNEDDSDVGIAGHTMRKFFEQKWTTLLQAMPKVKKDKNDAAEKEMEDK